MQTPDERFLTEIIQLCRETDETAVSAYRELASVSVSGELKQFWTEMCREEQSHVRFWLEAEKLQAYCGMPMPFADPQQVIRELKHARARANSIIDDLSRVPDVNKAFVLAFRMEFYLLHPAFETLFHLLSPHVKVEQPEDTYEFHIAGLLDMLRKQGHVSDELELLGESIQRLWEDNRKLIVQSTRDELTGLLNRRGFFAFALQMAFLAQRSNFRTGFIMMDIDHFKEVNDIYGHQRGDKALFNIGRIIHDSVRTSDVVGRYGGEEFIVFLPQVQQGTAACLAEKIRSRVENSDLLDPRATISLGVFEGLLSSDITQCFYEKISVADKALYRAKNSGRNCVVAIEEGGGSFKPTRCP